LKLPLLRRSRLTLAGVTGLSRGYLCCWTAASIRTVWWRRAALAGRATVRRSKRSFHATSRAAPTLSGSTRLWLRVPCSKHADGQRTRAARYLPS